MTNSEVLENIKDIIKEKEFGEIIIRFQNGKIVLYEVTEKTKVPG